MTLNIGHVPVSVLHASVSADIGGFSESVDHHITIAFSYFGHLNKRTYLLLVKVIIHRSHVHVLTYIDGYLRFLHNCFILLQCCHLKYLPILTLHIYSYYHPKMFETVRPEFGTKPWAG